MNFDEFEVLATRLIEGGDSNPAFLWDRVGHWAAHDGRWEVAEGYFRRAYDLEPANYGCCMGAAYNHLGRYMEAVDVLSVFLDTHEDDPVGWFNLAHAWDSIGHAANAIDAYERALALDKDYAAAMYNLGGVYWNAGQQGHACEVWKVAVARFPEHELAKKVRERIPELN
jgi:tetratricopeptide (TPR) repeat protein